MSQTTGRSMTLEEAALAAWGELNMGEALDRLLDMERPDYLEEKKWEEVLARLRRLTG